MTKRKIDWEAITREYRAGQLSVSEIARKFDCRRETISRKMAELKIARDLSGSVKKATASKVTKITSQVTGDNVTDEEIINAAAERSKDVILSHRKDINSLRELEAKLIDKIYNDPTKLYLAQYQGEIIEKTVLLTASELAMAANNLANVQNKRIALERQAFNIDEGGDGEGLTIEVVKFKRSKNED